MPSAPSSLGDASEAGGFHGLVTRWTRVRHGVATGQKLSEKEEQDATKGVMTSTKGLDEGWMITLAADGVFLLCGPIQQSSSRRSTFLHIRACSASLSQMQQFCFQSFGMCVCVYGISES